MLRKWPLSGQPEAGYLNTTHTQVSGRRGRRRLWVREWAEARKCCLLVMTFALTNSAAVVASTRPSEKTCQNQGRRHCEAQTLAEVLPVVTAAGERRDPFFSGVATSKVSLLQHRSPYSCPCQQLWFNSVDQQKHGNRQGLYWKDGVQSDGG